MLSAKESAGANPSTRAPTLELHEIQATVLRPRPAPYFGTHVLLLDGPSDTMMLVHDAKDRRGYAEGAVRAAEWLKGKSGFYDFRKIFRELEN